MSLPLLFASQRGRRSPWDPYTSGSLYKQLDEWANIILLSVGRYDVVKHSNTCFLQIFLWDRINGTAPRLVEFEAVMVVEIVIRGVRKKKKSHPYMPRANRWVAVE